MVVEPQVVHDGQTHPQQLFRLEQMADIGAGVVPAGRAAAGGVDGALIALVLGILDVDDAAPGVQVAVAGVAAGHNAVEQVHAAGNGFDDVAGCADAHQVADLILGHVRLHLADHLIHHIGGLAHCQAADGIAIEVHLGDLLHMLDPQVGKGAALVDAKQKLVRVDGSALVLQAGHLRFAAGQPADGAVAACLGIIVLCGVLHTLIKGHGDGRAQVRLDLHTLFRAHEDPVSVQMGRKGHALFGDLAQLGQAEHLKSAAIGQDGAVPAGELVQAAHVGHQLVAGAQMKVVGVAEHDLRTDILQVLCRQAALDGTCRCDVLERRGLHGAVHGLELAPPGVVLLLEELVGGQRRHKRFLSVHGKQPCILCRRPAASSEIVYQRTTDRYLS